MGDETIIYSLVARGTTVLAEHTSYKGNFSTIAAQCLEKLPANSSKHTYVSDHHTFNFLVEDGFTYLAMADEELGRAIPFAFLERVKDDFRRRYQGGQAEIAMAGSLNAEFGPKLQEHMMYVQSHPDEVQKISMIKSQVAEVKGVMMQNIEKVLNRNDKIDLLVDRSGSLQIHASNYEKQGKKIRRMNCFANWRIKLVVLVFFILIAMVIYLSICHGFVCSKPSVPGTGGKESPPPKR